MFRVLVLVGKRVTEETLSKTEHNGCLERESLLMPESPHPPASRKRDLV